MRKILTSLAAAVVLVAGAFVAATVVDAAAVAQESDTDTPTVTRHGALLADALSELVDEEVISQDQADAVQERVEQKAEERRQELIEEFGERPFRGRGGFGHFHGGPGLAPEAFEDGVLDADELAALPEDHPLRDPEGPLAEYLDDGQLTLDELREAHENGELEHQGRHFRGPGRGFGPFGGDTTPDAEASV
jgi:hypothetical protein